MRKLTSREESNDVSVELFGGVRTLRSSPVRTVSNYPVTLNQSTHWPGGMNAFND